MARIGIIGAGFMGRMHSAAIINSGRHMLVGIADRGEKGPLLTRERGCDYFPTAEELLRRNDIDIVHICVPTHLHSEYIMKAAEAGKHILCEKPSALYLEDIRRAAETVQRCGVKLMYAQVVRFWPENTVIKKMIDSGELGDLRMVYAGRFSRFPSWSPWYRDPRLSGGALHDLHVHDIDNIIDLLGEVSSVYSVGTEVGGAWNYVSTALNFANGRNATVEACLEMPGDYPFTTKMRIVGGDGCVEQFMRAGANLDDMKGASRSLHYFKTGQERKELPFPLYDPYQREIEHFADCVDNDLQPRISIEETLQMLSVMRAIEKSLNTHSAVSVDKESL